MKRQPLMFCVAGFLLVLALATVAAQELPAAPATAEVDLTLTDLDRAQREILNLNEQLRIARAQRAECEAALGPLEVSARSAENQRAAEDLKRVIEARHPGAEYDVATGVLRKKADPPKPPR